MSGSNGANDPGQRLAAIDVGTNSIRLIIAEARPDGTYRILDDEKEITRLGEGADEHNELCPEPMKRSADAITRLKEIAEGYGVRELRVVATSAVREASNGAAMVQLVRERAGVDLEIISGDEEARLAYRSAAHAFDLHGEPVAVVDVGGGSTEVVIALDGVIEQAVSLPLGAVRLTERFGACEDAKGAQFDAMRKYIKRELKEHLPKLTVPVQMVCGSGGTFTNIARISLRQVMPERGGEMLPFSTQGHEVQRSDVKRILRRLSRLSVRDRANVPGLSPERADIIVAGVAIVDRVMKNLAVNKLRVNDGGVRDGLLLEMASSLMTGTRQERALRLDAARRFGEACRYEEPHASHVAWLSLRLFDQLAAIEPAWFEHGWRLPQARELLEAAALLHDVGYLISYAKHHKHSYHIIMHGDLPGFTSRERELIANVARYHRRAAPKRKHSNFARLNEDDRTMVRRLAAILRIADGLDRTHTQSVGDVRVRREDSGMCVDVLAPSESTVDIWGATKKSALFVESFDEDIDFEWADPDAAAGAQGRIRAMRIANAAPNH